MIRTLIVSTFLTSCLFSTASFSMEDYDPSRDALCDAKKLVHIRFEKQGELDQIIKEYKETGKPISLAVACGSWEMPNKITSWFYSNVSAIENWIGLDLYSTDEHSYGGPHIRMDANNELHWQELAHYLKQNNVEVQTVALTIFTPWISSPIIPATLLPLVKKGGLIVYPECFNHRTHCPPYFAFNNGMLTSKYGSAFFTKGLASYYGSKGNCYQNQEALLASTMEWIGDYTSSQREAENRLEAKLFVNRVVSFNAEYLEDGRRRYEKLRELGSREGRDAVKHLFTKTGHQFAEDHFSYFKEYMQELGFDSSSYKIYYSSQELENVLYKDAEDYVYPKDGTLKLTGYQGYPSLILIKQ